MQKTDPLREQAQAQAMPERNQTLERLKARSLGKTPAVAGPARGPRAVQHQPLAKPLIR